MRGCIRCHRPTDGNGDCYICDHKLPEIPKIESALLRREALKRELAHWERVENESRKQRKHAKRALADQEQYIEELRGDSA